MKHINPLTLSVIALALACFSLGMRIGMILAGGS